MALPRRKSLRPVRNLERQSASAYYFSQWQTGTLRVKISHPRDVIAPATNRQQIKQKPVKERFLALAAKLCEEHPAVVMDAEVLGGAPHIKDTRLSVGTILAKLYLHGSIEAIVDIYEPYLSEEQVKEAIAYAQDFLEAACATEEP